MGRSFGGMMLVALAACGASLSRGFLTQSFNFTVPTPRPENDYTTFKARARGDLQHHYNGPRHDHHSGKAHSFAPPARPAKKKGYPRSMGRFY